MEVLDSLEKSIAGKGDEEEESSDGEESSTSDENTEWRDIERRFMKSKRKKIGRKSQWGKETTNDLIDIILENEKLKEKLLLTNNKNTKNSHYYADVVSELKDRCKQRGTAFKYNIVQTREKFKRCIGLCREAALKIKNSSGIQRLQEEKEYGVWFSRLFSVVKSMDNCQPQQSIEPSFSKVKGDSPAECVSTLEDPDDPSSTSAPSSSATAAQRFGSKKRKSNVFVPVPHSNKRASRRIEENLQNGLNIIAEAIQNDTSNELINIFKEESRKQQERDDRFMSLLEKVLLPQQQPLQTYSQPAAATLLTNMTAPPQGILDNWCVVSAPQSSRYGMSNQTITFENGKSFQNF